MVMVTALRASIMIPYGIMILMEGIRHRDQKSIVNISTTDLGSFRLAGKEDVRLHLWSVLFGGWLGRKSDV